MITPYFLNPGDKIAMVSVAGKADRETIEKAKHLLETEDFVVDIGPHAFDQFHMYAGMDADRAIDMQSALDDPEVKAIFFTRGGYGSLRTFVRLNWSKFLLQPKWLVGFSDITVFHAYLSLQNIASIHGVMSGFFFEHGQRTESLDRLLQLLRGRALDYTLKPNLLNRPGSANGLLVGGNLSILLSLRGTALDQSYKGKVLFLEDISEYDYHLDRMLMNLRYGGALAGLSGLVVGYFTDTKSGNTPYGKDAQEIIRDAVEGYNYPVVFGFPAGHELPHFPLLMGHQVSVDVSTVSVSIRQPL